MRLLLDTHALLWWFTDDPQLSDTARRAILDPANDIAVSAASAWEVATKVRLGKLPHAEAALPRWRELLAADGFDRAPIRQEHGLRAGSYASTHRDPFDRILAAQAELDDYVLGTLDAAFAGFPVRTLW
jgi:PIN domain nuclease of toxin-antitoxin system